MDEVSTVQGKLRYLLRGNDLAEGRVRGLGSYGVTGDCHGRDYGRRLEGKIEFAGFINLEMEIFGFGALKAGGVDAHGINADRE